MFTLKPLSAEHQYFPVSFLLAAINRKVSPIATIFPSRCQLISGDGLPVATQSNVASAPSLTVWSTGIDVKLGGTVAN